MAITPTSMRPSGADPLALYQWQQEQPGYYGGSTSGTSTTPAGSYSQSAANSTAGTPGYSDPTNGLTGQARVDASRGQVFANTEGRGQATMSDPYTQAALDRFKGVASGTTQPYDATTKNAMLSASSDQSAAAEASQAQQLQTQAAMNGGSVNDASSQAALRELGANRQGANQSALNGINMQANLANFDAANQGAQQLASVRSNQNAQANQMYLAGAGYRAQDYATSESPGGRIPMGQGMTGNQGYNPQPMPQLTSYQQPQMGQAPAAAQQQGGYYQGNGDPSTVGGVAQSNTAQGPQGYLQQLSGGYNPFNQMGLNYDTSNPMGLGYSSQPDYGSDQYSN